MNTRSWATIPGRPCPPPSRGTVLLTAQSPAHAARRGQETEETFPARSPAFTTPMLGVDQLVES